MFDSRRRGTLRDAQAAAARTVPAGQGAPDPGGQDATELAPQAGLGSVERATPTQVDRPAPQSASEPPPEASPEPPPGPPIDQATPAELVGRPERSEPVRVISMKHQVGRPPVDERRVPLHVQLRSIAEVAGVHERGDLGHFAPPRDPRQARARRRRDNVAWACVAIALACGIALAIWLLAGR